MSWFIDPEKKDREDLIESICERKIQEDSKTVYSFSQNSRFTDSFIFDLSDNVPIYYIPEYSDESVPLIPEQSVPPFSR